MAIKITLKNSVVQDSVPTTSHLAAVGELALNANINSLGIYMRASDNSIVKMAGPGSLTTPAASTTAAGIAELATSAETTTGTDTARVTTPAGVKAVTDAERTTSNNTYLAKAGGTLTGVLAATAGSNSAPAIHFGDTDSGIYGGTNTVSLAAGGTQGLTLSSAGKVSCPVGIDVGGASSSYNFSVKLATDKHIGFSPNQGELGSVPALVAYDDAGGLEDIGFRGTTVRFARSSAEVARFDSSGRLLVAHSSGTAPGAFSSKISIEDVDSAASFSVTRNSANNGGPVILLGKTRTATVGGTTIVQSGDGLGELRFYGADGTDRNSQAAQIKAEVDGTPGENDMPGRLVFSTTADGASTVTTRLTIDSAGLVNVPDNGKFTAGASDDLQIYHDGTNNLILGSPTVLIKNKDNDESYIRCNEDGAVELFHDASKKLETYSLGVSIDSRLWVGGDTGSPGRIILKEGGAVSEIAVTRNSDANSDLQFKTEHLDGTITRAKIDFNGHFVIPHDNKQLQLGAGSDLKIYHDGSNSYLTNSTGALILQTDNLQIKNAAGNESLIRATADGNAELYYDNSKKFQTESDGVRILGDSKIWFDAWQGRFDRNWDDYPSITITPSTTYGNQGEFRFHGQSGALGGYGSGSDFSIDVRVDGAFQEGSDRRRKTNIEEITGALATVKQLTGKKFNIINRQGDLDPNKGTKKQFGLIAQECEDIIPEVVSFHPDENTPNENGWCSAYGLDYGKLTPLLINAIKELAAKVETLETEVAALKG